MAVAVVDTSDERGRAQPYPPWKKIITGSLLVGVAEAGAKMFKLRQSCGCRACEQAMNERVPTTPTLCAVPLTGPWEHQHCGEAAHSQDPTKWSYEEPSMEHEAGGA